LKGASWFGYETSNNVFHGLWARDYHDLLMFLKSNGFNAIRVPFYLDLVLNDAQPNSINFYEMNADLVGLTSLQVLDKIIAAAADMGLLIMLDLHSFRAGSFEEDGLWYDATHPEALVIKGWDILMRRYVNQWNVVAFDLKNEPFSTTWGGPATTDWSAAVVRIANHILSSPNGTRMLVFVEGTASSPPCAQNCFWGENLQGPLVSPITISNQKKLVFSPHCYGPSVAYQPYFADPTFPANMPEIWDDHWGTVNTKTGQAVVLGEWGGQLANPDGTWLNAFVTYLLARDLTSQFFWCLNPDSGDTGNPLTH
jgi:endoglucanase